MMNLSKSLISALVLSAAFVPQASAQLDIMMPLQYGWQQTVGNPAALQDHRITVGLFSVGGGYETPISVTEAGTVTDGTLVVESERLISRLESRGNNQQFRADVDGLAFNYRRRGWQVGVSHRIRAAGTLDLPRDLIQLAAHGNARYVGQSLSVMPMIDGAAFQEFAVNGAVTFMESLTIGARAKYLAGSAATMTAQADAIIYTDPNFFESTITSDILINTAGVPVEFNDEGVEVGSFEPLQQAGSGFGLDLGIVFRPNDKMEAGLSVRDLGAISWSKNARQHRSQGSFSFRGYEGNIFDEQGQMFDVEATVDSVLAAVEFTTTDAEFTTTLPTTAQGTFRYLASKTTVLNATVYAQQATTWQAGFGVGVGQRVGEWLHVGALAGLKADGGYLGANILIDVFGPQIYVACDNVLAAANLQKANSAYFRAGLNLAFNKIKSPKEVRGFYDVRVEGINK